MTFTCLLLLLFFDFNLFELISSESFIYQVLNEDPAITFLAYTDEQLINMTITGPAGYWFSIGFNQSTMYGAYAIIINGGTGERNVTEHQLGEHNSGSVLPNTLAILNNTIINNNRTVRMQRASTIDSSFYYSFPTGDKKINVIWAYGEYKSDPLQYHSNAHRGTLNVQFYDRALTTPKPTLPQSSAPTMSPTIAPSSAPTFTPTVNYDSVWDISGSWVVDVLTLEVGVNIANQRLYFHFVGPSDRWFGFGFARNNSQMYNTYAFVINNNRTLYGDQETERILGDHSAGDLIAESTVTIEHEYIQDGQHSVMYSRDLVANMSGNDTELSLINGQFSQCNFSVQVLFALGGNVTFEYHSQRVRKPLKVLGNTSCSLLTQEPTSAPTQESIGIAFSVCIEFYFIFISYFFVLLYTCT